MSPAQTLLIVVMVFSAVMLFSYAVIIPTVSAGATATRKVRKRVNNAVEEQGGETESLVREGYTVEERRQTTQATESAITRELQAKLRQAGLSTRPVKVMVWSCLLSGIGALIIFVVFQSWLVSIISAPVLLMLPTLRVNKLAKRRIDLFEDQLPEALDVMSRALKAGHPFNETMNFVAREMDEPIAGEFGRVSSDINYGTPSKEAFRALMVRVPSVGLHTLITAVLIQQESGGALAEILEKVADVIRGRFRIQRKLKTLSAEGRMSAWVLTLLPFSLAGMLMIVAPDYLPVLLTDSMGQKIIASGIGMLCLGVLWIKVIINIKV